MIGIYLIVEAFGLGVIAWSFKAEDNLASSAAFGIAGCFSLLLAMLAAPIPIMLLTALLISLFRSKLKTAFVSGQEAILSFFRTDLPSGPQTQQTANAHYSNMSIIDVEAVDVSHRF